MNDVAKQILVVCTGNICRSPMAAGLIRKRLSANGLARCILVNSAGTMAREGLQVSRYAVELLGERGIVVGQHITHRLRAEEIDAATLILAMAEHHRRHIFYRSPENAHKVILLSELAGRHEDIRDPYGLNKDAFADALEQIEALLESGWSTLLRKLSVEPKVHH